MFAIVLAVESAEVGLAFITGGVAGGVVTAIFGPYAASRAARNETYRKWQVDLSTEFLNKLAALRPLLKGAQNPSAPKTEAAETETALDELDTLAQRVALIFTQASKAPETAREAAKIARTTGADLDRLDEARDEFIECASNEIRSRGVPRTVRKFY